MIEINLLPGTTSKPKRGGGGGGGVDFAGAAAGLATSIRDPWLLGAVGSVVVSALLVSGLWWWQRGQTAKVNAQLQEQLKDSTLYTAVIHEKRLAEAQRDSVVHQVELIRSFDNKRFVWPHLMDEVSRALPPYTWLTSIVQTNSTTAATIVQPPPKPGEAPGPPKLPVLDSTAVPRVHLRMVGNTVDIQALTRFMKLLEASPFIENVQLEKSAIVLIDGKEVTEFTLDASYQEPDPSAVKMVPVSLAVR